ncbi:zinc-binding dehydrogenase [Streptomyces sp. 147326]|uniref:zinc-binding dehydrogenase n=1 Tax=Streptomyces sp. 147326 TaxID=3074379 RepID=UPI0038575F97
MSVVVEHLRLGPDDTVLVNGAGGGVGHCAVQPARLAGAARVIAVASGRHEAFPRELGADRFVGHTRTAAADVVRDVDVDVLIVTVGGPDGHRSLPVLPVLRRGGRTAPVFPGEYHPERAAARPCRAGAPAGRDRPAGGSSVASPQPS